MSDEKLIKLVQTTFSLYGLTITRKLSSTVAKTIHKNPEIDPESWLTQMVEQILTQNLATAQVSLENIKTALKECFKPASTLKDTETVFNVIDVFTVPKVVYDLNKQKYVLKKMDPDLFPDAEFKSLVFKERLDLLWYRTLKHPLFAPVKFSKTEERQCELVPIDFVLSESKTKNVCIMGLLSQITEGQFWLEDYGGKIKINFGPDCFRSSLIMEGSIVMARGKYIDGIFQVEDIDFPPPEESSTTRVNIGDANTFGGFHPTILKSSEKLETYEKENYHNYFLFFSDFWVDDEAVLNKFKKTLSGYSDPPFAIILCGHFLSSPADVTSVKKLKDGFKKLASIVSEFHSVQQNTKFILVPGPYDLCAAKILPRPAIPKYVVEDFLKSIPNTHLATNPCRIQYCTKEIVVFRENILSKLCRNALHFPKLNGENEQNAGKEVCVAFANSIIRQSHLTPLLFSTIPVYWKYDQALQLYPSPDLLVVADDFQPYALDKISGCRVINPGSFFKSNFSFMSYIPFDEDVNDETVDHCEVPEDEF